MTANTTNRLNSLWKRAIIPHPAVSDPVQRQSAALLASIVLILLGVNLVALPFFLASEAVLPLGTGALLVTIYALSRGPRPHWGCMLLIGSTLILIIVTMPFSERPEHALLWLQLPLLMAAILLPTHVAALIGLAGISTTLLLLANIGTITLDTAAVPLVVLACVWLAALRAAYARNLDVQRYQAQTETLNVTTSRYQSLFDDAPVGLYESTFDGAFLNVNPALVEMLGYPDEATLRATPVVDLYCHPEERELWRAKLHAGADTHSFETQLKQFDGEPIWVLVRTHASRAKSGQIESFRGSIEDITASKQAQRSLEVERALLRAVIDSIPDLIFYKDVEGHYLGANRSWSAFVGLEPDAIIGKTDEDIADPDHAFLYRSMDRKVMNRREPSRAELWGSAQNGEQVLLDTLRTPFVGSNGELLGVIGISRDITQHHELAEQLAEARDKALETTKLKSEFLASMSHELRTPLNGIIGMTSLLLDTALSEEQQEYAMTIRSSGDALLSLINDILDFSKIEADKLDLEHQPFSISDCVEEAIDILAHRATQKGLELAYFVDPNAPKAIVGDVTRLRQVLVNLLSNAVKFTEQGEVVVTVESEPASPATGAETHQLHFAVRDTGIGIPEERLSHIFEAFTQVDASTTRKYGGTGLGLAICQRLVALMNGKMWVESVQGRGSTFHFTIVAPPAANPVIVDHEQLRNAVRDKRILIVDDNETNRLILSRQAQAWGLLPTTCESGEEALKLLDRPTPFDMAILDMQMPDMDGATLSQEIRKRPALRALPLVLLSSLGSHEIDRDKSQFAVQLMKPIKPTRLIGVISEIFSTKTLIETPMPDKTEFDSEMARHHPLRILVAEDNVVNQKVVKHMLERLGYRVDVVANGVEAVQAVQRQRYDLVLMDVEMPEMDGPAATRQIRQTLDENQQPYIIAATAHALSGDRERLLQTGMNDYISKPIRLEALVSALLRCPPNPERTES